MRAHVEWECVTAYEEWKDFEGVQISSHGRIFRSSRLFPHPYIPSEHCDGYIQVKINNRVYKMHRLVMDLFGPPSPTGKFSVDHINRNRSDNRIGNLRWATSHEQKENQKKHRSDRTNKCKVEYRRVGDEHWDSVSSMRDAADKLGIAYILIKDVVRGKQKQTHGYQFRKCKAIEIEGEAWKEINGLYVSNMGRVQTRRCPAYFPNPDPRTGYCHVKGRNGTVLVHTLVCFAFIGPRPSDNHTVDHINRVRDDNRAENLKWATKKEQANNRVYSSRPCRRIPVLGGSEGSWTLYHSVNDAASATGINRTNISSVLSGKRSTAGGMLWKVYNHEDE
jgi:plasmid maintenance system antidote protein VapI